MFMNNKRNKLFLVFILILSVTVLAGCKKSADKAAEETAEQVVEQAYKNQGENVDVEIDTDKGEVSFKNKEQGVSIKTSEQGNLEVPAGWPAEVSIYPDSKLIAVMESKGDIQLTTQTNDDLSKVKAWYDKQMAGTDWQQEMNMDMGDSWIASYKKDNYQLLFSAAPNEDGEGNVVSLNYVKAK